MGGSNPCRGWCVGGGGGVGGIGGEGGEGGMGGAESRGKTGTLHPLLRRACSISLPPRVVHVRQERGAPGVLHPMGRIWWVRCCIQSHKLTCLFPASIRPPESRLILRERLYPCDIF